jgi:YVTN family beta-propeller protein
MNARSLRFLSVMILASTPFGTAALAQMCAGYAPGGSVVSVLDTATDTVAATIPVGGSPFYLAGTPDGRFVYVTDPNANGVSVIFTGTNTVVGSPIPVAGGPTGIAIGPSGLFAYAACSLSSSIAVINTGTNTVTATIPVPGGSPYGIAISPNGAFAYVTNIGVSPHVRIVDLSTNSLVGAPIAVGSSPLNVALTPDGAFAYVANRGSGTVSVIDTALQAVVATIPVGSEPFGIAVTPDGARAYVAHMNSQDVRIIDTATHSVVGAPIAMGLRPSGLAIRPDGARVYVVDDTSLDARVIDTGTNTVTGGPIAMPARFAIAIVSVQGGCQPPPVPTATATRTATVTPTPSHTVTASPVATTTATATGTSSVTPTDTPMPGAPCAPTPRSGCRTPGSSQLLLKDRGVDSADSLVWKWRRGAATARLDFGAPTLDAPAGNSYAFCLYDFAASVPALVMSTTAPAGGTCVQRPCWTETSGGFRYSNRNRTPDGLLSVKLDSGTEGNASIMVRGKGDHLPMPTPISPTQFFHEQTSVVVQLVRYGGMSAPECWEATFPAAAKRNSGNKFQAKF